MNKPYVFAMRIYFENEHEPMADLAIMHDGKVVGVDKIHYDCPKERDAYFINAYTLIWDERVIEDINSTFSEYVNKLCRS